MPKDRNAPLTMIEAFPLTWPAGFERTKPGKQINSSFKTTLDKARREMLREIELLKGSAVIISTNIPVRQDGQFYATLRPVDGDTGVAVYFTWQGEQRVLACDQYEKIQDNVRAIGLSIAAMRGLDRWGASDILKRTFAGFKALPQAAGISIDAWWDILQIRPDASVPEINAAWKRLVNYYHPDKSTGNRDMFELVQAAFEQAKRARQ